MAAIVAMKLFYGMAAIFLTAFGLVMLAACVAILYLLFKR